MPHPFRFGVQLNEIRDRLERQREETGISYAVIQGRDFDLAERFAEEVMSPLGGK